MRNDDFRAHFTYDLMFNITTDILSYFDNIWNLIPYEKENFLSHERESISRIYIIIMVPNYI